MEIHRLIADLPQYDQIEMFIPENVCGYLIGRNGSHIKEIRDSSKARLNMDRKMIDNSANKNFSRLIISGTNEQIAAAKVEFDFSWTKQKSIVDFFSTDLGGRTVISIRTKTGAKICYNYGMRHQKRSDSPSFHL